MEEEKYFVVYWKPTPIKAKSKKEAEKQVDDYLMHNDAGSWLDVDFIEFSEDFTKVMNK